MSRNVGTIVSAMMLVSALALTGCCHSKPWPLGLSSALNTSHAASQEVAAYRADTITAGQPVDDQGSVIVMER